MLPEHGHAAWKTHKMKIPKLFWVFAAFMCAAMFAIYIKWNLNVKTRDLPDDLNNQLDGETIFYGIMFDAGSTGTRIHVFNGRPKPSEDPRLRTTDLKHLEVCSSLKLLKYSPFLSLQSAEGINELLAVAKEDVPENLWKSTPLVLKATAGLRLLPGEKAQELLDKVKSVFQQSPFLVGDDCVSIMDGTDEGTNFVISNCISDRLNSPEKKCVGMLDLGGGSTQITFHPRHSHFLTVSNFLPLFFSKLKSAFICHLDAEKGGALAVSDFETAAKKACNTMEVDKGEHPFLCMDLTYIIFLLEELGFPKNYVFKLKLTGWPVGRDRSSVVF
uniref:Ectonucleoside triphosphate diphosphohydrolase 6 n=1 Tax=Anolis carolinensis TaxID=28377 RepID=G1KW26_ANOCA